MHVEAAHEVANRLLTEFFKGTTMKTTAYNVTVRRIATGCDFHIRLFAADEAKACERATDRARFAERITTAKIDELHAKGIAVFHIVSCVVSPDQSRPIG